eukprot:CAMPEP_0170305810 /NCGR_PEP_ID=MMETSP0116_2-20130129/53282_1 /TAXON_ID=400756 /ORGANISM="Durinskia baltica, Strain CSIRO CS-38" /LENGTH=79 /DNA_ID=CAMNT_0010557867 /DNA_START=14 /DNA_END=251 /DNA_ORIENTATION=-
MKRGQKLLEGEPATPPPPFAEAGGPGAALSIMPAYHAPELPSWSCALPGASAGGLSTVLAATGFGGRDPEGSQCAPPQA